LLLYWLLHGYLRNCEEGPPWFRRLKGQRIFERILVTLSWRWARRLETVVATRRLQPQLRILTVAAAFCAVWALWGNGDRLPAFKLLPADPVLVVMWIVGGLCAMAAAHQAKFHRLAALIFMSGAGLVTCMTFVWFSAPDLALTQMVVEIV